MLQTMVKRQHEASEDEHERVRTLNNARQRKRRAHMDSDQKEELRLRNREAKRRSRQKKREVNSPSVGHPAPTDSEAWDAVTAAVHRVLDMNQSSSVDPSGSHPPSTIEDRAVGTITMNPRSPPAPPSSNALAAPNPPAQDIPIDPALVSQPLTSLDDPLFLQGGSFEPTQSSGTPLSTLTSLPDDPSNSLGPSQSPSERPQLDHVTHVIGAGGVGGNNGQRRVLPYLEVEGDDAFCRQRRRESMTQSAPREPNPARDVVAASVPHVLGLSLDFHHSSNASSYAREYNESSAPTAVVQQALSHAASSSIPFHESTSTGNAAAPSVLPSPLHHGL
ncbi:hypothetical protein L210DRAFT_2366814 [Boletus edulis BED1]|uniref:BZIP domain-containing protein n=1 Tax=Boletus edulis BED1 TaxID=1328754 RepID=A0AAD4BBT2_BOLED|nr:hypothetical protein L210DRAFT_2366814 [Boletus edulis BED1]